MNVEQILLMAAATLVLASCSSTPPLLPDRPPLPANLASPCASPSPLADDSMGSIASVLIENTQALNECSANHLAVVSSWRNQ